MSSFSLTLLSAPLFVPPEDSNHNKRADDALASTSAPCANNFVTKRATPTLATPCPIEVVISLNTQISIPDYGRFYQTPVESFRPRYFSLPDGTLMAPPMIDNLRQTNLTMLILGALLMLFLRNTIVSADYIRRGRVKYKALFYTLLLSQVFAPISIITVIIPYFFRGIACALSNTIATIFAEISYSLLVSGVLGVKAYRCLDRSKVVLVIMSTFQIASSTLIAITLMKLHSFRSLSGTCSGAEKSSKIASAAVLTRFLESLFISLCFLYALWKSSIKLPAAQGRISLRLSGENEVMEVAMPETFDQQEYDSGQTRPRGWWDYVPEATSQASAPPTQSWVIADDRTFTQNLRIAFRNMLGDKKGQDLRRKPSLPEKGTLSSIRRLVRPLKRNGSLQRLAEPPKSPTPSAGSRLNRLMSRMPLFREVMQNELAHTAFITLINLVTSIPSVVAALDKGLVFPSVLLIGINWAILSLIVIHNFGRVVARHEREAIIQNSSAWDPAFKFSRAGATTSFRRAGRRTSSPVSIVTTRLKRPRSVDPPFEETFTTPIDNPFSDFEFVREDDRHLRPRSKRASNTQSWMSLVTPMSSEPASPTGTVEFRMPSPRHRLPRAVVPYSAFDRDSVVPRSSTSTGAMSTGEILTNRSSSPLFVTLATGTS